MDCNSFTSLPNCLIITLIFGILVLSILPCITKDKITNWVVPSLLSIFCSVICLASLIFINKVWTWQADKPFYLGLAPLAIHFDGLANLFLVLLTLITVFSSLGSIEYLKEAKPKLNTPFYWSSFCLFIASMLMVILANNAITFLVFWEIMAISSSVLVLMDYVNKNHQKAGLIYLCSTRISSLFLYLGFFGLNQVFHSWDFSHWQILTNSTLIPSILVILGFLIKAGAFPFHLWLPYAHPAAIGPVSALMSGIMIKLSIYGIIRLLTHTSQLSGLFYVYFFMIIGVVSAFWGILFALIQHDVKRSLAYSSVENIGLILIALSIYIYGRITMNNYLEMLGFIALIYHIINHAVMKSLLFLSISAIDAQIHNHDLYYLGGLIKKLPITGFCFLIGGLSITSLPPLNGFVSKWLIYTGLFGIICSCNNKILLGFTIVVLGLLAMVGAMAVLTFTKVFALLFLGRVRSDINKNIQEKSFSTLFGQIFLAVLCVALGIGSNFVINYIVKIFNYQDVFEVSPIAYLPLLPLLILLFGISIAFIPVYLKFSPKNYTHAWGCGTDRLSALMQVNSDSYSHLIASYFRPILQYDLKVNILGYDKRHFPETIESETLSKSLIENNIYTPIIKDFQILGSHFAKLQAGSIHLYLLYIVISLVVLLYFGVRFL